MVESSFQMLEIATVWIGYFVLHSVLASDRAKDVVVARWPQLVSRYRLFYNATALMLLAYPLKLTYGARGELLWEWPGAVAYVADALAGLAGVGFVATLFAYDLGEFSGLQSEPSRANGDPKLRISFFHRFVRHPWYFFGLVMLWSREMDQAFLTAAIVTTVYLIVGSRIEERRLVRLFGERYRAYRRAVPGLFPLPWRSISVQQAAAMESKEGSL